jgi:hypothetical protein
MGVEHPAGVNFPRVNDSAAFGNLLNGVAFAGFAVVALYFYILYRVVRKLLK